MTDDDRTAVLLLTDDEVVALGEGVSKPWWGRTPTVDRSDATEAGRAVARGMRSLGVRGLLDDDGVPIEELAMVGWGLGAKPWGLAAPVDSEDRLDPAAAQLLVFGTATGALAWRTDPLGTHALVQLSREAALELLTEQLVAVDGQQVNVAVTLTDARGDGVGGYVRHGDVVELVDRAGMRTGMSTAGISSEELAKLAASGSAS